MAKNRSMYKIEFSIDNLSLKEQQNIFETVLAKLDYNQRQNFHVTVIDFLGGKHNIWDGEGTGIDPNGEFCKKCKLIDCESCVIYLNRLKERENGIHEE